MSLAEILAISVALAMDAFAVALSTGISGRIRTTEKILFIISFGFFQFLFSFTGAFAGYLFDKYIFTLPSVIGGIILFIIGLLMFKDGFDEKDEKKTVHWSKALILGVSVSIDALAVGFSTLNKIGYYLLLLRYTLIIGIVTAILTLAAFLLCRYIRRISIVRNYADFLGGIVLMLYGLRMIL